MGTQPSTPRPATSTCISNHPTIDYSNTCDMLAATCEQYSFCMRVAPGGGTPSPIQQRGPCISNHPTIDYSVACQALESTCEQHNFCKRNHAHETKKHPKPVNDGAEPESEGEATPEVE